MAVLEVHGFHGRGLDVTLVDDVYVIGRAPACEIHIDDDGAVSRAHARLNRFGADVWSIVDLDTRNGTRVDGKPIVGEHTLRHGEEIALGRHTRLVFRNAVAAGGATTAVVDPPPELTAGQRRVLVELVRPFYEEGRAFAPPATVAAIAKALYVGDGAVKNQLSALYDKFGIFEDADDGVPRHVLLANAAVDRGAVGPKDMLAEDATKADE